MAGRAMEWVADWRDADYCKTSPATDPTGPTSGEIKIRERWLVGLANEFVARSAYRISRTRRRTAISGSGSGSPHRDARAVSRPTIVAMGGGGFSMEPENPLLDDYVLDRARAERGRDRPRVCFVATASGDGTDPTSRTSTRPRQEGRGPRTCRCSSAPASPSSLVLLEQDVIYVGGGNTANMLASGDSTGSIGRYGGRGTRASS
jgi:hypothetical protein